MTVNPSKTVGEVDVLLAETGGSFRISLSDWEDWLDGEWFDSSHHEVEREALAEIIPLLRSKLPTAEDVIARAGIGNKPSSADALEDVRVVRISHELACQKLADRVKTKGIACPHCGVFSNEHHFVHVGAVSKEKPASHLACCACGQQFGPEDV